MKRRACPPAAACFLLLVLAPHAYAHRVNVFASVENGRVKVEAYFSGGAKAKNCDVLVYGAGGAERLKLKTDAAGEANFAPAKAEDLKIVVETPDGHRGEYKMKAAELGASDIARKAVPSQAAEAPARDGDETADLKAKLAALRAQLGEMRKAQDNISARDVIAGLGFIFGLTALCALLWRKRSEGGGER